MTLVILEIDAQLCQTLKAADEDHQVSFEEECRRRLESREQRSPYFQALVAELRAAQEQRRAGS